MRNSLLFMLGLTLGGCAWDAGQGFAVVEPTVRVAYEPLSDRAVDDGYQRLSSDYQVHVDSASMRLSDIELLSSSGGTGGTFDPANPPAGYSLCHGGHCHRDDGALIPYEQVAAELGGGGGSSAVVTFPVGEPLNLLAPETRPVACEPDCALPEAQVSQGRWSVGSLHIEGTVRDGRATPRLPGEHRFKLDLAAADSDAPVAVLDGAVNLPSDRSHPPQTKLDLDLVLTAALFDPLDWSTLKQDSDGVVDFNDAANAEARKVLLERLARFTPTSEVTRGK
ncbi:hypothetical protein [Vitiosangium sp. GDMCC 1.1324]|uniref:hypothetical protein n=1 Tax=Vitiosangium sp. (strain GDMCC 1.1324) TaxID=2138576 RepID=UPI000D3A2988|nr:hypothetical protein [Vitiosangium sp. GDMCC 1.1324]PTL78213.1 hypothetical protein DAT35_39840 [Vitiosangium sp. GDMCC 1.1324]